jgi:hypothetical protein
MWATQVSNHTGSQSLQQHDACKVHTMLQLGGDGYNAVGGVQQSKHTSARPNENLLECQELHIANRRCITHAWQTCARAGKENHELSTAAASAMQVGLIKGPTLQDTIVRVIWEHCADCKLVAKELCGLYRICCNCTICKGIRLWVVCEPRASPGG